MDKVEIKLLADLPYSGKKGDVLETYRDIAKTLIREKRAELYQKSEAPKKRGRKPKAEKQE